MSWAAARSATVKRAAPGVGQLGQGPHRVVGPGGDLHAASMAPCERPSLPGKIVVAGAGLP